MKFHHLMATALLFVAMDSRAALIRQYELNGNLNDALGGKALAHLGGSTGPQAYAFGPNQGLRLDEKLGGTYSIDMRLRLDAFNTGNSYTRLIDFKSLANDNGLYLMGDQFRLYSYGDVGGKVKPGEELRMTLTRGADKQFRVYQNGDLVLSVADAAGFADFTTSAAYFFRDDGQEAGRGAVDFIHIYNHALSADEVRSLEPAEVPEPGSLGMMATCLGILGWMSYRRNRKQGKR